MYYCKMLNDKIGTVNILFKDIYFTVYCYPCINATSHDAMKMCANRTQAPSSDRG